MENIEEEPPPQPPFWLQPATTNRHGLQPHLSSLAVFLRTGFLVTMLFMLAIVFLVFVIPSLISLAHQVFRPSSVKKSWDSLNLLLILFALICGFLGIKGREDPMDQEERIANSIDVSTTTPRSPLMIPNQDYGNWYGYGNEFGDQGRVTKLVRASSSYPDLRQDVDSWGVDYDDHRPRYYDDSYAINHIRRPPRSARSLDSSTSQRGFDGDGGGGESASLPPPAPPQTPPMYYSKIVKSPRKEYESIGRRSRKTKVQASTQPILKARPPTPPPPPPAPSPPPSHGGHQLHESHATKEMLTSMYQQSKRKKSKLLRRKSHDNLKDLRQPSPPPTPPPQPSKRHNIFSPKKAKSCLIPNFSPIYETIDSGYESPIIPIPPPPPPPPFKLPPWKFAVEGDYIKINSSPKGSGGDESELDDNAAPAMFCPSPDVNTKADDFIARFKATLKLEKINSIKMEGMGIGLSPLGPDSSPSPSPSPSPHATPISASF